MKNNVDIKEVAEYITIKRLITETYPNNIVSLVSDSFDYWRVISKIIPKLKDVIMARSGGALGDKVVIRPDSGDPADIICGTEFASNPNSTPEEKGSIQCLWDTFGGTINEKGYKVLDPHIGLIYGDSITLDRANNICERLHLKGFASTNVVFGIGSFTYEYVTRDSLGWAMKATAGTINGKDVEIFKDPKTDDGIKKSAKGFMMVAKSKDDEYVLVDQVHKFDTELGYYEDVFLDGELMRDESLSEIRERLWESK